MSHSSKERKSYHLSSAVIRWEIKSQIDEFRDHFLVCAQSLQFLSLLRGEEEVDRLPSVACCPGSGRLRGDLCNVRRVGFIYKSDGISYIFLRLMAVEMHCSALSWREPPLRLGGPIVPQIRLPSRLLLSFPRSCLLLPFLSGSQWCRPELVGDRAARCSVRVFRAVDAWSSFYEEALVLIFVFFQFPSVV